MQASLTKPPQAYITSGDNPVFIGEMSQGQSRIVYWTLVFTTSGSFQVSVTAAGYKKDGGGYVEATGSTTLHVYDPLLVTLLSPLNTTYTSDTLPLDFTVNKVPSWMGYSLDGEANVTITGNTTIAGLLDGPHCVEIYANDSLGAAGSDRICFSIDTAPPTISLLEPQDITYPDSRVPLSFSLDEEATWMGYSLDGEANVTITGNTTMHDLSNGLHNVVVYANDTVENTGASDKSYFTVQDVTSPAIIVVSPSNTTYATINIPLVFTANEAITWVAYSLNGQENTTISGNSSISGLTEGPHEITVYAKDSSNNIGKSESVHFSFELKHDVAITDVKTYTTGLPKSVVGQGYSVSVYATVENQGSFTETFNVTIYSNGTAVDEQASTLLSGESTVLTLTWSTLGFSIGNYTMSSYAWVVQNETDIADNTFESPLKVTVTIPGDVDGDHDVDLYDAVRLLASYGTKEGEPSFDPNLDINGNGQIFLFDAVILLSHYGQQS